MEVLFVFLKWVASFSYRDEETGSRMDLNNIATVICPSILYSKSGNAAKDESFMAIEVVSELLATQDEYYRIPWDLLFVINENIFTIFARELDLPPKEIHRHCQKYLNARAKGLPPSASGQMSRDRDPRTSVHRSDGNLAGAAEKTHPVPIEYKHTENAYRPNASPGPLSNSRPTSWAQAADRIGSQQSLHQQLNSPSATPWRAAPFHGRENGSRNSSRGSAPNSPAPEGRVSLPMEKERSRTPVGADHRMA